MTKPPREYAPPKPPMQEIDVRTAMQEAWAGYINAQTDEEARRWAAKGKRYAKKLIKIRKRQERAKK